MLRLAGTNPSALWVFFEELDDLVGEKPLPESVVMHS
jgi:hypothetical protein